MSHLSPSEVTKRRITKWLTEAKPVNSHPVWVEYRQAIDVGDCTYIISNGQVFQCAHCGQYDPEWSATEVLQFFKEVMGIYPYEIEVTCSVAIIEKEDNG